MTYAEQIAAWEAKRAAAAAAMKALNDAASTKGENLDAGQQEEFDGHLADIAACDQQLKNLRVLDGLNLAQARPVEGADPQRGADSRAPIVVRAAPAAVAPGMGFTRYVKALAMAKGDYTQAFEIAKANDRWAKETPDVISVLAPGMQHLIRTAVAAGNTTDATNAAPLVQYTNLAAEFIEFLRPMTIVGRLNLRMVPFKVKIPRQTGGSTVNWVGEGKVKPVGALAFDSITLDHNKISGIIVLTEELVRLSSPAAEMLTRDDLAAAIVQFMDSQFVDPSKAADDVSPASILNGVTAINATGSDLNALKDDVFSLMQSFVDSNLSIGDAAWIMTQQQALAIGMMRNALGQREYADISVNGGTFEGLPVIASENIPATGGSPTDGYPIILVKQQDVLLADEGQVLIDASREASIQMETTPDSPATASTVLTSLWQHNMVGIRAERMVTWKKRRAESAGYIASAKYRP